MARHLTSWDKIPLNVEKILVLPFQFSLRRRMQGGFHLADPPLLAAVRSSIHLWIVDACHPDARSPSLIGLGNLPSAISL
jgi:hypothetical protein